MKTDKPTHYLRVKEEFPEYISAVEGLGQAAKMESSLDEKSIQLIQLAASVAIRSEGAVHSHARRALEAGVTAEEIKRSVLLLTSTIGFPLVMAGLTWINDIVEK